MYFFY